jgi:hypothetical protein
MIQRISVLCFVLFILIFCLNPGVAIARNPAIVVTSSSVSPLVISPNGDSSYDVANLRTSFI